MDDLPFDCAVVDHALREARLVTTWSRWGDSGWFLIAYPGGRRKALTRAQNAAVESVGADAIIVDDVELVVWDGLSDRFLGLTQAEWRDRIYRVYHGQQSADGARHEALWLRMGRLADRNPDLYLWFGRKHMVAQAHEWRRWALEIELADRAYRAEKQES